MKSRRGISSVVGAVFAIIALGTTVGYITYSMTTLDNYNQTVLAKNQQLTDIANEKFQLSSATFVNNKLNITILNTGTLPINITKIWISNQTLTCSTPSCYINYTPGKVVSPGLTQNNIGQLMSGSLDMTKPYNVKLVTSRGNMIQFNVNSANTAPVDIQFYALPSNVQANYTTELVMVVKNNGTGTLSNITPALSNSTGSGTATFVSSVGPTPPNYNTLPPGSTAIFKWDVTLTGKAGKTRTFTASLTNPFPGNTASTTITIGTTSHVGAAPLNIKLTATPPSLPTSFKTQLIMTVTNNGTSTLTNLIPTLALQSGNTATCTPDPVTPSNYDTLPPGGTAIFSWAVAVTGTVTGQSCSYGAYLQNGYVKNYANATITETLVSFTSTNLAANTGVLSVNYTTWEYTTGTGWQLTYNIASGSHSGFSIKLTNNDPSRTFYLSNKTSMVFTAFKIGTQSSTTSSSYILANVTSTGTLTKYTCAGYPTDDYCSSLAPGQSINLSIGGDKIGNLATCCTAAALSAVPNQAGGGPTTAFLLIYGKFDTSRGGNAPAYAQNIPYIAIYLT